MCVSMSLQSPMKGVMRHARVQTDSRLWEGAGDEEEEVVLAAARTAESLRGGGTLVAKNAVSGSAVSL